MKEIEWEQTLMASGYIYDYGKYRIITRDDHFDLRDKEDFMANDIPFATLEEAKNFVAGLAK